MEFVEPTAGVMEPRRMPLKRFCVGTITRAADLPAFCRPAPTAMPMEMPSPVFDVVP